MLWQCVANLESLSGACLVVLLQSSLGISRVAKFSPGKIIPSEFVPGRNFPLLCSRNCGGEGDVGFHPQSVCPQNAQNGKFKQWPQYPLKESPRTPCHTVGFGVQNRIGLPP